MSSRILLHPSRCRSLEWVAHAIVAGAEACSPRPVCERRIDRQAVLLRRRPDLFTMCDMSMNVTNGNPGRH